MLEVLLQPVEKPSVEIDYLQNEKVDGCEDDEGDDACEE
jgi:hypothetical protein